MNLPEIELAYELVKAYDDPANNTISATVSAVAGRHPTANAEVLQAMALAIDAYVDSGSKSKYAE